MAGDGTFELSKVVNPVTPAGIDKRKWFLNSAGLYVSMDESSVIRQESLDGGALGIELLKIATPSNASAADIRKYYVDTTTGAIYSIDSSGNLRQETLAGGDVGLRLKKIAVPAAAPAGYVTLFMDNSSTPVFRTIDENGNIVLVNPPIACAISQVSGAYATETYLAGSGITVPAGGFRAGAHYRCTFDMVKTAVGTQTPIIRVRIGTAGTTADTERAIFTFGNGTAAADIGQFEIFISFYSVGSGTAAVVAGTCRGRHNLATTGLFNNASGWNVNSAPSAPGFDSSTATKIGVTFNGGTSFSGTTTIVQARLNNGQI